ncbi:hypothetical protein [Streptomyces echinatus]|uniref:hypothetical protein n=1 Tax=Streptomyces echinatus TaxID=67293 RepID=UPI003793F727
MRVSQPATVIRSLTVTRGDGAYFARIKRETYMSQTVATPQPVRKGKNLTRATARTTRSGRRTGR